MHGNADSSVGTPTLDDAHAASAQTDNMTGNADSLVGTPTLDDAHAATNQKPLGHLSELHTAIREYFTAAAENRRPSLQMFRDHCFAAIDNHANRSNSHRLHGSLTAEHAANLPKEPNWEEVVTMATPWAFQDKVAIVNMSRVTAHPQGVEITQGISPMCSAPWSSILPLASSRHAPRTKHIQDGSPLHGMDPSPNAAGS